jgi:hypothetical protein
VVRGAAGAGAGAPWPVAEEAEVVHEHDHRVEPAQRAVEVLEGQHLRVPYAAAARDADDERRDVDGDDRVAPLLQLESDRPAPAPTSRTRLRT